MCRKFEHGSVFFDQLKVEVDTRKETGENQVQLKFNKNMSKPRINTLIDNCWISNSSIGFRVGSR